MFLPFAISGQNTWKTEWIKQDKAMHISVSTALTMLGTNTANDFHMKNPEVVGIAFSLTAGLVKELILDEYPSGYDLTADIVGAVAGVYLNRWVNKWETKWLLKSHPKKRNVEKYTFQITSP